MKKLLLFFTVATVAAMTGCHVYTNFVVGWDFSIINQTDYEICFVADGIVKDYVYPGEKFLFADTEGGKYNCIPLGELFHESEIMRLDYNGRSTATLQIKVGEELMPDIIFQRKYWDFVSNSNTWASYTLTVTDELIETINNHKKTQP